MKNELKEVREGDIFEYEFCPTDIRTYLAISEKEAYLIKASEHQKRYEEYYRTVSVENPCKNNIEPMWYIQRGYIFVK